jgi:hypothetical protein
MVWVLGKDVLLKLLQLRDLPRQLLLASRKLINTAHHMRLIGGGASGEGVDTAAHHFKVRQYSFNWRDCLFGCIAVRLPSQRSNYTDPGRDKETDHGEPSSLTWQRLPVRELAIFKVGWVNIRCLLAR